MASDLFQELAATEIPPLPEDFDVVVHERLNRSLIVLHVLDFLIRGLPLAMLYFGRAVIGLLAFTLTGEHVVERRTDRQPPEA